MVSSRSRVRRAVRVLACLAVPALAASSIPACSSASSGSTDQPSASGTASSTAQKAVWDLASKLTARPTAIPITTPITKTIPSGKKIIWIDCGAPVCDTIGHNFADGAEKLGWSTQILSTDGTPASVQKAFNQALVAKPDALATSGVDPNTIGAQLKGFKAAGIPVVAYSIPGATDGITLNTADATNIATTIAEPMAAWVSADSNGKANTLYTTVPGFAILKYETTEFQKVYSQGCPGCKLSVFNLPITSLGKDAAQLIVARLRSDPSITYIADASDAVTIGLPAALKAAGLADKVKIIGGSSTDQNLQYIATGQQAAGVPNDVPGLAWQMVDGLARIFTGMSSKVDEVPSARYIITKDNVPPTSGAFPFVADYQSQFLKLWGKS